MERFKMYGFSEDKDRICLNEVFENNIFSSAHIDVFVNDEYMLLSRNAEKNVTSKIEDGRMMLAKKDDTVIVDILLSNIDSCMVKRYGDVLYEFVFKVHNVFYKSLVAI